MKFPKCGKKATIIPYGAGYIAVCCGEVIYNANKMPEDINAKS